MRVALLITFAASRKEPLGEMLQRVNEAFIAAGLNEPKIGFNFGDSPIAGGVSSVDRVLKRHRELERFVIFRPRRCQGLPGRGEFPTGRYRRPRVMCRRDAACDLPRCAAVFSFP